MKSKRNLLFRSLFFLAVIFLCIGSAKRVDAAAAAKIGSRRYKTVAKALYAAKNGDTVKLLRNASYIIDVLDKDPIKKKKITINLNHKTLDIMGRMRITKKSNVKIKNGKIITSSPGHFRVEGKSKVTMTNCTLETNSGSGFMVSGKKSSLKLNKCTGLLDGAGITAEKKASLTVNKGSYRIRNYSWFYGGGAKLTFNGPEISSASTDTALIVIGPNGKNNSSLTINGGTYKADSKVLHIAKNQTCNIKSGNFFSQKSSVIEVYGKLNVKGGSINGGKPYDEAVVSHGILAFETARINLYSGASISSQSGTAIGYSYYKGAIVNNYGAKLTDAV